MLKNIKNNAKTVDIFLKKYFKKQKYSNLIMPMKYGTLFGGKKIRSTIILNTAKIFKIEPSKVINICAAVECIHSYSLIHDDLPCMDNDKLRRGKPSTHVKFGESTAILSGNSLLTLAFEIITDKKFKVKNSAKVELLKRLAECAGHVGIAGGQFLDLSYENKKINFSKIISMQRKKTGKLFEFCCLAPAIVINGSSKTKRTMSTIGSEIGLLFQIADDFLDIKGSKKNVGKPVNKDIKKGKSTLIKLIGYNKTLEFALKRKKLIIEKLKKYGKRSDRLMNTVNFILNRTY
ncbi:MAG: geranyl transferase [Candidatus Pelagibacter sp.]|nr:geranyl transferase [Candidatus Pelagibacter sp.]|tara:strand:- start:2990 stop:3862 length:873 start_codon:yes stop_codon:yes gene_type:complete